MISFNPHYVADEVASFKLDGLRFIGCKDWRDRWTLVFGYKGHEGYFDYKSREARDEMYQAVREQLTRPRTRPA